MTKRHLAVLVGLGLLILIASSTIYIWQNKSQTITLAECERVGGVVWRVDLFHPDICPSCAEYRACEIDYNDYRNVCPECYGACQECQESYSLYESCPECYGPCQDCQNEYLNDFENEEERHELCPECKKCDECRGQLKYNVDNCPPCISCNDCKEENKKYSDIQEVCPQSILCAECMERNAPYPDTCPNGRKKVGEISDVAIWFQCCR